MPVGAESHLHSCRHAIHLNTHEIEYLCGENLSHMHNGARSSVNSSRRDRYPLLTAMIQSLDALGSGPVDAIGN